MTKKILGFEIPKTEQAGYWGRPTLTPNQVTYAAVDVAVLPQITRETKQIVEDLGIEDAVYRRRIGASEIRVAERVAKKLAEGGYVDHFDKAEITLRRATTVEELDNAWHSFRQMALVATSFERITKLYEARSKELSSPRKGRRTKPKTAAATPF
jgi:ribonuclease D